MSKPVDPRLVRHVPAARPLVAALAALQAAGAALVVAQAVLLADVVVTLFGGHAGVSDVLGRLIALAAVGIGRAAVAGGQEWVTTRGSVRLRAQLRRTTLAAIVRLGPGWADRQEPGRLVNATGPGLDALDGYVSRALPALVSACVVPPVVLFWILLTDWQSGLIFILLLPLVPLFMVLIGITTNRLVERQYRVLARLAGQFLDLLRGLTTLRIYGQAETQEGTLRKSTEAYRRQTMATLRIAFLSGLVLDLIAALSIAIVAVEIGLRLDGGHVTFATALLVLLLAPELFAPLRAVGAQHHASQEGAAAAAAALDIVDEAPDDLAAAPGPAPAPIRPTGRVELTGLTIDYPGRTEPAVDDLDLVIEAGEVVALTGPSGAGKSTVLAAVLGFVAPTDGRVTVGTADGPMSAAALDAGAWRDNVAWLPQRPRPSQATVADEIRLGDQDADPAAIAAAGQTCHAPDPDVALGEDGRSVSAGQRRRIALARVLLRARAVRAAGGVPIVLLDEPSEDLDRETETVVASVISDLAGWASVVVATHSTVLAALADVQIRIADGRIAERVVQPQPVRERAGAVPAAERVPVTASAIGPVAAREPAARPAARRYRLRDLAREAGATRRLALAVAFSALAALSGLGLMASSMWLISRAAQHPNVQALAIAVVGVRTFAISRALLRYAERLSSHDGALRMLSALRVRVFAALRPLSPDVLGAYGRGDLLRRFVGDVDGAQEGLVRALIPLSGALAGALGAVVIATALTPIAGVALAVGLAVAGVAVPALSFRAAGSGAALVRLAGDRDRRSSALLDALGEVVAYGAAERAVDEVAHVDTELAGAVRRPGRAAASGAFGGGTIAALTLSTVLAAAADAASSGQLSVVNVGVLAVCVLVGFESVSTLPAAFVAWARCRAGLERVSEVTSAEPVFVDPAVPAAVPHTCVGLRAASIDLAPAPGARAVLRGADLDLAPGARIAVVGPSGCGKSTLLTAALRMLPVQRGTLSLTGPGQSVDLSDARAADVPPVIAGSLQGDHVFDATLRDNLRVVRPAASDSDLDAVARRAGLRELIATLPEGWSTPAGPDGAALSGGQRQRLLLARALLADPAVLVLDEPTAHLDADTERRVLDDLLDATAGRTVLMTTHRRLSDGRVDAVLRVSDRALVADAEACAEPCPA